MTRPFQTLAAIAAVALFALSARAQDCPEPGDPAADPDQAYQAALCRLEAAKTRDEQIAAFELVHAAAKSGSAEAMTLLGDLYDAGTYLEQDPSMAAFWFLRGAKAGDPRAQLQIGLRYILGLAVNPDPVRGYAWVVLAERSGLSKAAEIRAKLDERVTDQDRKAGLDLAPTLAP